MQELEIKLTVDDEPDFCFRGYLIAQAENDGSIFSLYKTESNKYVCHKIVRKTFREYRPVKIEIKHSACVIKEANKGSIIEFFGFCSLAKKLYDGANIDATRKIE